MAPSQLHVAHLLLSVFVFRCCAGVVSKEPAFSAARQDPGLRQGWVGSRRAGKVGGYILVRCCWWPMPRRPQSIEGSEDRIVGG
jgi:hypothetical protein